jgi:hypothetical protein
MLDPTMLVPAAFGFVGVLLCGVMDRLRGDKKTIISRLFEKVFLGVLVGALAGLSWWGIATFVPFFAIAMSISWSVMGSYLSGSQLQWGRLEWWQGNPEKLNAKIPFLKINEYNPWSMYLILAGPWTSVLIRAGLSFLAIIPVAFCPTVGAVAGVGLAGVVSGSFLLSLWVVKKYFKADSKFWLLVNTLNFGERQEVRAWGTTEIVRGMMMGAGAILIYLFLKSY